MYLANLRATFYHHRVDEKPATFRLLLRNALQEAREMKMVKKYHGKRSPRVYHATHFTLCILRDEDNHPVAKGYSFWSPCPKHPYHNRRVGNAIALGRACKQAMYHGHLPMGDRACVTL
jgi:hypothetical protein